MICLQRGVSHRQKKSVSINQPGSVSGAVVRAFAGPLAAPPRPFPFTSDADKAPDTKAFVQDCRVHGVLPFLPRFINGTLKRPFTVVFYRFAAVFLKDGIRVLIPSLSIHLKWSEKVEKQGEKHWFVSIF